MPAKFAKANERIPKALACQPLDSEVHKRLWEFFTLSIFADLLQVPIGDVGDRSFQIDKEPVPVSSTCVVYAKSEATGLLRKGWQTNEVLAAYCSAMAD